MKKGEMVTTSPMLPLNREYMDLLTDQYGEIQVVGQQLILNYCFGHKHSTLLLFPIAPVVSAINHNTGERANAKIQWSTVPYHRTELLEMAPKELFISKKTGLIIEFVATRDIDEGEEIFINYGLEWQSAWREHVENWSPEETAKDYKSSWHYTSTNDVIRTNEEEKYPDNIMIRCVILGDDWIGQTIPEPGPFGESRIWQGSTETWFGFETSVPCEIVHREMTPGAPVESAIYTARINSDIHGDVIVTGIPDDYIFICDQPYTIDDFLPGAFRHEINVPDEMFPDTWNDLKE